MMLHRLRKFKNIYIAFILLNVAIPSQMATAQTATTGITVNDKNWAVAPRLGFSPHTSVVGAEIQYRHAALTVGVPATVGLKYYARPFAHSWYVGPFFTRFTDNEPQSFEGVGYDHVTYTYGGMGFGYRWLWRSRWNLQLGLAVADVYLRYENSAFVTGDRYITLLPDLAFGLTF